MKIRDYLILKGIIGLLLITALINSGLNGNYIIKRFLNKARIIVNPKKQSYRLEIINRTDINIGGQIIKKISFRLDLREHSKKITLNIIK